MALLILFDAIRSCHWSDPASIRGRIVLGSQPNVW